MSIADKLQELINSKADMKSAIAEKGVDVEGGLTTYADAIRKIQQWSGDRFAAIGYNGENTGGFIQLMDADIEVSKRILAEWNSTGSFDMTKWKNIAVYFPAVDLTMKPTDMRFSFNGWSKLQVVPDLDFTGRTNMNALFHKCKSLKYIGNITGTESVTNMSLAFSECSSLTSIPQMDTRNVQNMGHMFSGCTSLTSIPQMDTRSAIATDSMFSDCINLTTIPPMVTSNVTSMFEMFHSCKSLTSIPLLDCSSVTYPLGPLGYSTLNELTDLGGFKDLKVSWDRYFLDRVPNATVESLMNVINNLYDLIANGLSGRTLSFGTTNLNKLTDEQKAVAINKGWTLI